MPEWFLYMSQYRLPVADFVARAQAAEAGGFDGVAFFDHLETPGAPDFPVWEAMTLATWVAAKTERIRLGHLVLCDAFRHPAVLAKQAVTLSEASGGRFELGIGSGSMPKELAKFDLYGGDGAYRSERLDRDLSLLKEYWGLGEPTGRSQSPLPTHPIPIVIGGTGPRTLDVVRRHADWWNLPAPLVEQLPKLLPAIGSAKASVQQMVGFVRDGDDTPRSPKQAPGGGAASAPAWCVATPPSWLSISACCPARARNGSTCGSRTTHRRIPSRNSVRRSSRRSPARLPRAAGSG